MLQLPIIERMLFYSIVAVYVISAVVAVRQISPGRERYRRVLISLIALGVSLQSVFLIFRAVDLKAFPLTGLFESMVLLGIVFGLTYLFLSVVVSQVWFGSVMTWIMLLLVVLSAKVAGPAVEVHEAAKTPWAIAHGLAMTLSAAMIAFSAASAWLYLVAHKRLKNKQLAKVIGRLPNVEKLRRMNLFGIETCFVLLSFGVFIGMGLAAIQIRMGDKTISDWLVDPKIVLIAAAWILLGAVLLMRIVFGLSDRAMAYMTMVIFFLIIFAIVGVAIFCGTGHVFSGDAVTQVMTVGGGL
jgi:ABC-type transport system involved in cytochrome c biogenesis permease subunit